RLAEYYSGEGATPRLQITSPVGQYVPEFEPGPAARGEAVLPAAPPLVGSQPEVPAEPPRRGWIRSPGPRLHFAIVSAVLLVAALLVVAYYVRIVQRQGRAPAQESTAKTAAGATAELPFGPPPGDEV